MALRLRDVLPFLRRVKPEEEVIEQATAAPGEKRDLPKRKPRGVR